MADVNKIRLPNGTDLTIKDSRITGVDNAPTSGSGNVVTSGGVFTALQGKQDVLGPATILEDGLMSASDKEKLDSLYTVRFAVVRRTLVIDPYDAHVEDSTLIL